MYSYLHVITKAFQFVRTSALVNILGHFHMPTRHVLCSQVFFN